VEPIRTIDGAGEKQLVKIRDLRREMLDASIDHPRDRRGGSKPRMMAQRLLRTLSFEAVTIDRFVFTLLSPASPDLAINPYSSSAVVPILCPQHA
jgi:hypothetical protein